MCESRDGRPGLPVRFLVLMVFVDVKEHLKE